MEYKTRKNNYKNFRAALYIRSLDLAPLRGDITPFRKTFERINKNVKLDKVYLETHRDLVITDEETILAVREYLTGLGIETSGGITATIKESDNFKTYCYSNPVYREKMKEVVQYTARLFDEVVFDDFYFTNCKCPLCIAAKGEKSWTQFRLELMTQASKELVLGPAREVNPNVNVVIKYPNWYEHFQGLGFNLKDQPPLYDGLYTGNETRDAVIRTQHLQPYESYLIFRYFENIKPGGNRGGWVDPFATRYLDRYAEQLWLTLFAKSPEITLFDYYSIQLPVLESLRGTWQGQGTSFSFDAVTAQVRRADGSLSPDADMSLPAGVALAQVDKFLGELGNPIGVKSYKPYHSTGEDFLHNYLGMLGIPMDLVPEFPEDSNTILLTEAAKYDADIVKRIEAKLMEGKTVIVTTGLLRALQGKGFEDIVEMECSDRKQITHDFMMGRNVYPTEKSVLVPIVHYFTNDSWELIHCMGGTTGTPLLHWAAYGNSKLYVLTIPDNFDDLYYLPSEILGRIREVASKDLYVQMKGPSKIALFVYDNHTFIVESFRDEGADIQIAVDDRFNRIEDILTGEILSGEELFTKSGRFDEASVRVNKNGYNLTIKPHSYRVFRALKE